MKIFIGLIDVAGYYSSLKKAFDEIGVEATFVSLVGNPFNYQGESSNSFVKLMKRAGEKSAATPGSKPLLKTWRGGLYRVLRLLFFIWALLKYDVFILGHLTSFYNLKDLAVLKFMRKKIIYVFNGSDSRPPYIDAALTSSDDEGAIERCIALAASRKESIKRIERYADAIINHPPSAHFHERPFASFTHVGVAYPVVKDLRPITAQGNHSVIRILHSPSVPQAKGTDRIRQAITNLQSKGHQIEFVEIIGQPNSVVLEEIGRCDFIVDSVYSDTSMSGFVTEAALRGKPSVVGGYELEAIGKFLGRDRWPPSYCCHPDEIEEAIERLIVDEDFRRQLGEAARLYVEGNWNPRKVAERFLQIIEGRIPENWLYDPRAIRFHHGYGMSEERAKRIIRNVIGKGGNRALQLSDKPELESLFVDFAFSQN